MSVYYFFKFSVSVNSTPCSFQTINVLLRDKPDWFLSLTPVAKVPIVLVGQNKHFESLVTRWGKLNRRLLLLQLLLSLILHLRSEYLDEKFPSFPMRRSSPEERAKDKEMVEMSKRVRIMY